VVGHRRQPVHPWNLICERLGLEPLDTAMQHGYTQHSKVIARHAAEGP